MTNHLTKRGNVYYFRRKIPVDLQEHFQRKQIMFSLNTHDYSEAKRLAATHTVITDAEFAAARAGSGPTHKQSDNWARLMNAAPHEELYAETLEQQWQRDYEANPGPFDTWARARQEATAEVDKLLNASGLPTTRQLDALRALGGWRSADLPTPEQSARATGQTVVPAAVEVPPKDAPGTAGRGKTLRDVIPSWVRRTSAEPEAVKRVEKALRLFEEAVGIVPLCDLRKAHGAQFVAFLLDASARGFVPKTAHNHASYITALLNIAVKDDLIERNPLDLSIDKSIGSKRREPWSDAELKRMYGHTLFSNQMGDVPEWQGVKPVDGRSLLLILQHTGARIGEIAQMRRGDFQRQDGMTMIRITAEAGTVKTADSERTVPLANHLLADVWFSGWLAEVMDGKCADAPAFPSMAGRVRGPGDTAVQWFKEFRDDAGLPAGALNGSHKFRHWIRTAMNALDVAEATQDAITGHAVGGSTGKKVYTHVPLTVMYAALNRINFPKAALS